VSQEPVGLTTFVAFRVWWIMLALLLAGAGGCYFGHVTGVGDGWDRCNEYGRQLREEWRR